MTEYIWREISCQKSVAKDEFDRGVQDFNFQVGHPTGWIPSKSYFKIDMTLTGKGQRRPTMRQAIAFADNAPAALYNNVYFRAGGQDVSSIVNHVPQIAQVKTRLQKTLGWQQSMGASTMLIEPDFDKRVRLTASAGGGQVEEKYTIASIGDATHFDDATVTIGTDGTVAGVDTVLNKAKKGDKLVLNGVEYVLDLVSNATSARTATRPVALITPTSEAYLKIYERTTTGNTISAIWQPPIGIFDHTEALGSGDYRFQLNPNSDYKRAVVETINSTAVIDDKSDPTVATSGTYNGYNVVVHRVRLYVCTVKGSIPSGVSTLHLLEASAQSKTIAESMEFTVPSSTRAISVFVQHASAGSNPLYPPTRFTTGDNQERTIDSIQLTYANCTKPATRWESAYDDDKNELQQRYLETQLESNLIASQSGPETMEDWLKRGPVYHFTFEKDEMDKSTQVQLAIKFRVNNPDIKVFCVAWYSRASQISTQSGVVVDVSSLNV